MFKDAWEKRFFVLLGGTLATYLSEADAAGGLPRGTTALDGRCAVRLEGWKRRRYWTWALVDASGADLLRLSAPTAAEGEAWVAALKAAGARVQPPAEGGLFGPEPPLTPLRAMSAGPLRARPGVSPSPGKPPAPTTHHHSAARALTPAIGAGGGGGAATAAAAAHTRASAPVHREPRASPMSNEALLYTSHAGLVNLVCIVLVVNHARLILENLGRYGVRVRASFWVTALGLRDAPRAVPVALAFACLPLFAVAANAVELAAFAGRGRWERSIALLHTLNLIAALGMPIAVIHTQHAEPLPGFILLSCALVLWMKLVSYAHANADLRATWVAAGGEKRERDRRAASSSAASESDDGSAHSGAYNSSTAGGDDASETYAYSYPRNLALSNLVYFVSAPTLCYQPNYPRSPRLRPRWLARRVVELAMSAGLVALIIEQYMLPAVTSSALQLAAARADPLRMTERLLKLSIPTLYVWLCIFYSFFHCWLNIVAEATRFGDRGFYKEWWNATTIEEYWRLWNLPVHKWLARHLYFPAMRMGCSKSGAMLITFAFSAAMHELLVGVPCHLLRGWAAAGILGQIPLIGLTNWMARRLKNEMWGNIVFWLSFCIVGQPMAIVLYFSAYQNAQKQAALLHPAA